MKKIFIGLIMAVALNLSAAEHEVKMLNFGGEYMFINVHLI